MFGQKTTLAFAALIVAIGSTPAASQTECADLPDHAALTDALKDSVEPTGGASNGGLDLNMC